jgi:NAD(P)-dependent dehydrogenase (short-subunit alcohol dehydrogenase family)
MFEIEGTTALVTGANRGIGLAIVDELFARGAAKVYLGARDTSALEPIVARHGDRAVPVRLDVTNPDDVAAAAETAADAKLIINNAGVIVNFGTHVLDNPDGLRQELDVNVFGPLALTAAFRDRLEDAGGAVVNVNSIASLFNFPAAPTYSATKAAMHSLTQAMRTQLGPKGVTVLGVYPGPVDTDMAEEIEFEKATPESVAQRTLDALARGDEDVYPDDVAAQWHRQWADDAKAFEQEIAQMAAG